MTVKEFDEVSTGVVDYMIFDQDQDVVGFFTMDLSMESDQYRRNMVQRDKFSDAVIYHVYSVNDIIHVVAIVK